MQIKKSFEIRKPSECNLGDLIELDHNGFSTFACLFEENGRKFAVSIASANPDFRPIIFAAEGNWDGDCFYYPRAVLEIERTSELIKSDFADAKIGSLRILRDSICIRAHSLDPNPRAYWIDLPSRRRMVQAPDGTEFYAERWKLWADPLDQDRPHALPLADVTAKPAPPR